jgi:hypothetical protein
MKKHSRTSNERMTLAAREADFETLARQDPKAASKVYSHWYGMTKRAMNQVNRFTGFGIKTATAGIGAGLTGMIDGANMARLEQAQEDYERLAQEGAFGASSTTPDETAPSGTAYKDIKVEISDDGKLTSDAVSSGYIKKIPGKMGGFDTIALFPLLSGIMAAVDVDQFASDDNFPKINPYIESFFFGSGGYYLGNAVAGMRQRAVKKSLEEKAKAAEETEETAA